VSECVCIYICMSMCVCVCVRACVCDFSHACLRARVESFRVCALAGIFDVEVCGENDYCSRNASKLHESRNLTLYET